MRHAIVFFITTAGLAQGACRGPDAVALACERDRDCPLGQRCGDDQVCADELPAVPVGADGPTEASEGEGEGDPAIGPVGEGEGEGEGEPSPFGFAPTGIDVSGLAPSGDLAITCDTSFDTDARTFSHPDCATGIDPATAAMLLPDGTVALVVHGLSVQGQARLRAVGAAPLALVAFGDAMIAGVIDAGSNDQQRGAGARTRATCGASAGARGDDDDGGAGGGGGAGAGAQGGGGGSGEDAHGGAPGVGVGATGHLGGCPGGAGGDGDEGGGAGGEGGGAIHVAVAGVLDLVGTIAAPGGGGGGGRDDAGGGGGGSGGLVRVEAGVLHLHDGAALTANGGGGGGGGDDACFGGSGDPGADGAPRSATRAEGGAGFCFANGGGAGGAGGVADGAPGGDSGQGAGGGGGGAGVLELRGQTCDVAAGAVTSPVTSCAGL